MDVSTEKGTEEGKGTGPSSIGGYYGLWVYTMAPRFKSSSTQIGCLFLHV